MARFESVRVGGTPRALAVEGSSVWVLDLEDRLIELDRESGQMQSEYPLLGEPREIVAYDGALWITLYSANQLARFDPASHLPKFRKAPGGAGGHRRPRGPHLGRRPPGEHGHAVRALGRGRALLDADAQLAALDRDGLAVGPVRLERRRQRLGRHVALVRADGVDQVAVSAEP